MKQFDNILLVDFYNQLVRMGVLRCIMNRNAYFILIKMRFKYRTLNQS